MTDFETPGAAMASAERELGSLFENGPLEITADTAQVADAPVVTPAVPDPAAPAATAPDGANVQAAPAAPLTPAVPVSGANTPGASTSLLEDPDVKKALGIYGNDPKAAANGFLETNTRNARMAEVLKNLGYDPKTLQPLPVEARPVVEQTPQVPVTVDTQIINAGISQLLNQDPEYNKLVESYTENDVRLSQIKVETKTLGDTIKQAELALTIPEIKADGFKSDEYKAILASANAKQLQLSLEQSILDGKQDRLNGLAERRANAARTVVNDHYTLKAQAQHEEVQLANARIQAKAEMATSLPLAVDQAMKAHGIPQDLLEDFKTEVRLAGRAYLADDKNDEIADVFGFVNSQAQTFMDKMDRFHRLKSAAYGAAAVARTATATGVVAAAPAPSPISSPTPPRSVRDLEADLEKDGYLVGKAMGLWT